ncbi:hypothetical protein FKW77_003900 [Venturia effusa]|uniref:Tat pathway signal sequence n=1 Tax=Venturia effusa TaxID=50376 RepID=A0A517LDL6_9PEZI|nr:hypothetical protein FKW77_003900 [Venturia effusa]
MDKDRSPGYCKLDDEERDSFDDETPTRFPVTDGGTGYTITGGLEASRRRTAKLLDILVFIGEATLLRAVSFALGWRLHSFDERSGLDTAWNKLRQSIRFETRTFDPHFRGEPSPYMGRPTPEVDRLWYDLAKYHEVRNFGVDHGTLEKLNLTKGAVQFPGTGTYQVGIEAYHQLHCLNYIRMYTYQDHYGASDYDMIAESPDERQTHKDHCVEILRQRLMCNPDLNVYTYHWGSKYDVPFAHLFTSHRCVNWDAFHDWSDMEKVRLPGLKKPDDAEVFE